MTTNEQTVWSAIIADIREFFDYPDDDEVRSSAEDALDKAELMLATTDRRALRRLARGEVEA